MFGIEINYSWGDSEDTYGNFETAEEAYKEMCSMAAKEAYIQNEEFLDEEFDCDVHFSGCNKTIDLHYNHDDEWCYYRVVEIQ